MKKENNCFGGDRHEGSLIKEINTLTYTGMYVYLEEYEVWFNSFLDYFPITLNTFYTPMYKFI